MKAIEIMMEEHRYIERMLKEVRKACYKIVEKLGSTGEVIIKNGMLVEHDLGRSYVKELIESS